MPVKIRLQRKGRKKKPFYFIVVADSRAPRDGKFIQKIGTYNPLTVPASINLDRNRALHWLQKGAQPTDTVRRILSFKGVLYLKHLMRGVKLGLFDEQAAMEKFDQWLKDHEDKVLKKRESHRMSKQKEREAAQAPVEEPKEEPKEEQPKAEEPKEEGPKEEQPKVEEPKEEEPKEEQPKVEEPKEEEPKVEEPKEEKQEVTTAEDQTAAKTSSPVAEEAKEETPKEDKA